MTKKPPRQQKTPKQRAEETLAAAQRIRDRLHKDAQKRRQELEDLDRRAREAEARLDYAKKDPALTQTTSTTRATNQAGATA